jgi:hypothetical protein
VKPERDATQDDGLAWERYRPHEFGGPVHLVNVTINETVDGRSQMQQNLRKGVNLAVGPSGVSVGVRHHARWIARRQKSGYADVFLRAATRVDETVRRALFGADAVVPTEPEMMAREEELEATEQMSVESDAPVEAAEAAKPFRVFPAAASPELLDVGQWTAISGAAVSTGLGSRTSFALSLLTTGSTDDDPSGHPPAKSRP